MSLPGPGRSRPYACLRAGAGLYVVAIALAVPSRRPYHYPDRQEASKPPPRKSRQDAGRIAAYGGPAEAGWSLQWYSAAGGAPCGRAWPRPPPDGAQRTMADETRDTQPPIDGEQAGSDKKDADQQDLPENRVNVEDIGSLKKKVTVTIPRERIDAKLGEMFGELRSSAQVPGFRIGHAPRRLIEKRFGKEVAQDVRNALIGESIGQAIEKADLKAIGEPDLDLDKITLPDAGDMEFSFEAEVAPEFDLPELKGIKITKPSVGVTDERIDAQISQWAASQATYRPTEDAARADDTVIAGARVTVEGVDQPAESPGLHLRVAPGQIEGIPLLDLGKALEGAKAGGTATLEVKVNDAHPNEQWRGKNAKIAIEVSQVNKRVLPEVNDGLAKSAGFESLADLRGHLRSRAESQLALEVQKTMHAQVEQYLLDSAQFDVPAGAAKRHTDGLLRRRLVSLLQKGVPRERIDEQLTELQAAAGEQAVRDLKLHFILDRVAEQREIKISPEEVNARVAQIASLYNRRPERLRQELAADGTLQQLEIDLREEKAVESLLAEAEITEKKEEKKRPAGKPAAKKAKKAPAKKSPKAVEKPADADAKQPADSKTKKAKKSGKKD